MNRNSGFTILELMVIVAIIGVLATVAVPSFQQTIMNNRLATQVNDFVSSLQLARSESVKRGTETRVCKSADGAACAAGGGWHQGWLVWIDFNGDGVPTAVVDANGDGAADETEILGVGVALKGSNTLVGDANVADEIRFNSRGFATGFNGTFTLCDSRGAEEARGIVVANTGRVRRAVDLDADGIEEDASNNPLACP